MSYESGIISEWKSVARPELAMAALRSGSWHIASVRCGAALRLDSEIERTCPGRCRMAGHDPSGDIAPLVNAERDRLGYPPARKRFTSSFSLKSIELRSMPMSSR